MPAAKISEEKVTAIRSALEGGALPGGCLQICGDRPEDAVGLAEAGRTGEERICTGICIWLSSRLSPESFRDEEFHLKYIKTASTKNWFALAWYLERKHPERWAKRDPGPGVDGPKDEVEVIG